MITVADCSFVHFVYPFVFDPRELANHIQAFDAATYENRTVWREHDFLADDLMPHVADFLNLSDTPEYEPFAPRKESPPAGAQKGGAIPTARLWKLNDELDNIYGLADRAIWSLLARSDIDVPFKFGEVGRTRFAVHLALFCSGVGFLTVQARPRSDRLNDWLDFIHYFRICNGQRSVQMKGLRRTGANRTVPFFPAPACAVATHSEGIGTLQDIYGALLRTGQPAEEQEPWWEDVFVSGRMLPYVSLYVDGLQDDEERACLLFRLRNFLRSGQEIIPGPADLCLNHPANIEFALHHWFVFSLEGSAFVGCDAPQNEFFRSTMPQHLHNEYFLLFLLALQQRFALIRLSDQVARKWHATDISQNTREAEFGIIRDSLLSFTARGYFAQVMQTEHYHRCYVRWLETFQIERLYREVRDEVQDMHDYILLQQSRRQEEQAEQTNRSTSRLTKVAGAIGVPGLALTTCQALAVSNPHIVLPAAAAALAFGGGMVGWMNRSEKSRKARTSK
jgi:hypothetical protein